MGLTKKQINLLNRQKVVVLGTANLKSEPRCIFVEVNMVYSDKIIITDNEMKTTRKNILENPQVFILAFKKDYSYGLKISGIAEYHKNSPYFDFVRNLETNKNYKPKGAIVIIPNKIKEF